MHIVNLYNSSRPIISMEFFPPRTEKAEKSFKTIINNLTKIKPDYMTVTFGAGGSTREGSYKTIKQIMNISKIPTIAYIAGYGLGPDQVTDVLNKYKEIGIETIFVVRGDKPQEDSFISHVDSFSYASEMIEFIKSSYNFTLGCAGYPEGHIEAESLEKDINYLKLKVKQGAEYIVSQYFYDNEYFFKYVEKCKSNGIKVPIIPGIMPIYTIKMTNMLSKVCGTTITNNLKKMFSTVDTDNKEAVLNLGIDFAFEQCKSLLKKGVSGLHFYTMNRSRSITEIIERLRSENLL